MDMVRNQSLFGNLNYVGEFGWGKLDARLTWQDTEHEMGFFTQEKSGTMPMNTHGRDLGYAIKAEIPVADAPCCVPAMSASASDSTTGGRRCPAR